MRLVSPKRLSAFVGREPDKKMSARRLARSAGVHPSFINHLTSGRCRTAKPVTAERIAEALEIPLDVLFVPTVTSSTATREQSQRNVA